MIKKYLTIIIILIVLFFVIFGLFNLPGLLDKKEQIEESELIPTIRNQMTVPINTPIPTLMPTSSILAPTLSYIEIPNPTDL